MQSLYSCKWICNFTDRSTREDVELMNRLLQQAYKASGIRDENRSLIIDKIKTITWNLVNTQNIMHELEAEINLAMKLHEVDHPNEKEDRYFVFDANGHIRSTTQEEFIKATPKDALDEIERNERYSSNTED